MRIASKIKTEERWTQKKVDVMKSLIKEKIRVCAAARTALLSSGSNDIIEDTTHEFWGRGRSQTGQNMLGKIWMQFREQLQRDPNFPGRQVKHDQQVRSAPKQRTWATRDRQPCCYRCGEPGHMIHQCRQHERVSCWACGRAGHKMRHCRDGSRNYTGGYMY
jgi:hypothetical protein